MGFNLDLSYNTLMEEHQTDNPAQIGTVIQPTTEVIVPIGEAVPRTEVSPIELVPVPPANVTPEVPVPEQPIPPAQPVEPMPSPVIIPEPTPPPEAPIADPSSILPNAEPDQLPTNSLTWSANEFVEHKKSASWFVILILVLAIVSVGIYFLSHSIYPPVMIMLIGIVFAVIAARSPKLVNFEINNTGFFIGKRFYSYNGFKSFSIVDEDHMGSIVFNPFKRFAYPSTILYELEDEDKVLTLLTQNLPVEEPPKDIVDQLMRKLHF